MREIKFRKWNGQRMMGWEDICSVWYKNILDGAMQYTGLKDKNGTEIYEADILGSAGHKVFEVKWTSPTYVSVDVKDKFNWMQGIPNYLEVIGNIYENPELLK